MPSAVDDDDDEYIPESPSPSTRDGTEGSADLADNNAEDDELPDPRLDPYSDLYDPNYKQHSNPVISPSRQNWLTDELTEMLDQHKPSVMISADSPVNEDEMKAAFNAAFEDSSWKNSYQLHQAVNYLGDMYGFTTSVSGYRIFCSCGRSHRRKKSKNKEDGSISKKRNRIVISDMECDWYINSRCVSRPVKGDNIPRHERAVMVTTMSLDHNHTLNKGLLMKAKKATHKYSLKLDTEKKLIERIWRLPMFVLRENVTLSDLKGGLTEVINVAL